MAVSERARELLEADPKTRAGKLLLLRELQRVRAELAAELERLEHPS